jgi:hypothetical protein
VAADAEFPDFGRDAFKVLYCVDIHAAHFSGGQRGLFWCGNSGGLRRRISASVREI